MGNIVWLASYPKSGNTWFRAFLANLFNSEDVPVDINNLGGGPIFSSRQIFDRYILAQSSDMLPEEIDNLRPAVYCKLSKNAKDTLFIKAHDAYTYLKNGQPLFPTQATKGALYLVRNPLDVSVSFANHSACCVDKIITKMNKDDDSFCGRPENLANQLRQLLLGWSNHVRSWLNAKEFNVHIIRYEDMKQKPLETFHNALKNIDLTFPETDIQQALEACDFHKLKKQEEDKGFREKCAKVQFFFRKGVVGSWKASLTDDQTQSLIKAHGDLMKQLGYLDKRGNIVFSAKHTEPVSLN